MTRLLLLAFVSLAIGCNSVVDDTQTTKSHARPPNPEWLMPAGKHEIGDTLPPTVFLASIEGFAGPSFKVELDENGKMMYSRNPDSFTHWGGMSEEIFVTNEMWNEFRYRLNNAEVWKWRRRYDDPGIADGTVWKLRIEYASQSIVSSGSNAYPEQHQFNLFLAAVSDLADGKPFE